MKLSKLKRGMILWDVHSERAGNTRMRSMCIFPVTILQVNEDHAVVSWNGNPPRRYTEHSIAKLRVSKPVLVRTGMFDHLMRLETPAEKAKRKSLTEKTKTKETK